jgi:hypothetical protein
MENSSISSTISTPTSSLFGSAEKRWNQLLGWFHPLGWAESSHSVRGEAGVRCAARLGWPPFNTHTPPVL